MALKYRPIVQIIHKTQTRVENSEKNGAEYLQSQFQIDLNGLSEQIKNEVLYILTELLQYPSSKEAQQHQKANKLGTFDLKAQQSNNTSEISLIDQSKKAHCKDCGLIIQDQQIPICTSFDQFPKIGIATYLFFQSIKNMMFLIVILAAIYSGYALYINITQPSLSIDSNNFPKKLSFASVIENLNTNPSLYDSMQIQGWLIVGTVLVWWFCLFVMINIKIKHERMVDDETITAADFSIMIENVPISYEKKDLQKDLIEYYEQLSTRKDLHQKDELKPFVIRQFCKAIPFYYLDDESIKEKIAEIDHQMHDKREEIAEMIEEVKQNYQLPLDKSKRKEIYDEYLRLSSQKAKQQKELKKLSKNYDYMKQLNVKTNIFVSFLHSESANVIDIANLHGFSNKMRYYLSCCKKALFFNPKSISRNKISVSRASQPQDIIWENIGIPDSTIIKRKLLTYFVTLILLGLSFGIVYGLTILQMTYNNSILSILISLSITVINIIIAIAIRKLTIYQSDISSTNRQISLAIKSIFAQMLNSIVIPVITNLYIEKNLYETNGLVYDVFNLAITSAFLPPILKFIDIPFVLQKLKIWKYQNPFEKLQLNQKRLNQVYEYAQFQLGVAHIYYIDLFYFTCFYVHIHPCIVIFTLIGFFLMYWAQKNSLLSRSRRPTPSSSGLNQAMGQLITFAPCVFSLGGLIWFNIIRQDYHNFSNITYLSHLAAIGFSVLFYMLPFNTCCNAFCFIADGEDLNYDQVKSKLTSQYSLLNPVTSKDALFEFFSIDKNKKQNTDPKAKNKVIQSKPEEKKLRIINVIPKYKEQNDTIDQLRVQDMIYIPKTSDFDGEYQSNESIKFNEVRSKKPQRRKNQQKTVLIKDMQGYNKSALKRKYITEDNPYKNIKF